LRKRLQGNESSEEPEENFSLKVLRRVRRKLFAEGFKKSQKMMAFEEGSKVLSLKKGQKKDFEEGSQKSQKMVDFEKKASR
jgi:hypothetical protein